MRKSEIVKKAIEEKLWRGTVRADLSATYPQSCNALFWAAPSAADWGWLKPDLLLLGMPKSALIEVDFNEFPAGPERQQARALWLTWMQLMYEEGVLDGAC